MIDLEFGVSYDGMRIGDKELVDCINALREIVFSDEEIQKKLDECKVKEDVTEVKRGRWMRTDSYPHRIYCSNCYGTYALDHWGIWIDGSLPRAYCPNCGAKMGEVEE